MKKLLLLLPLLLLSGCAAPKEDDGSFKNRLIQNTWAVEEAGKEVMSLKFGEEKLVMVTGDVTAEYDYSVISVTDDGNSGDIKINPPDKPDEVTGFSVEFKDDSLILTNDAGMAVNLKEVKSEGNSD